MSEMLFTPTGEHDEYGGLIFRLSWDGGEVLCVSGLPEQAPCLPSEDFPGSCRPIPEGIYRIGAPVKESESEMDPAIGPDWVPLYPLTDIGGRDGLLIHRDWNYIDSPGTAGCIAPVKHAFMDPIIEAVKDYELLRVDYGFGTLDQ